MSLSKVVLLVRSYLRRFHTLQLQNFLKNLAVWISFLLKMRLRVRKLFFEDPRKESSEEIP